MYLQLMEANEKLKLETDSHNKTKKQKCRIHHESCWSIAQEEK